MNFKEKMESAKGLEGKLRPVHVGGFFFYDNPDAMSGYGVKMRRGDWSLHVEGKGFVCGGEDMCYPVRPWPMRMNKETAKELCKTGIAHWGDVFFVESVDYYKKLIEKAVKKMGYIQLDNPVEIHSSIWKNRHYAIDHIDYVEGIALCVFYNHKNKIESLNCYTDKSIVLVGRELVKTLLKMNVKLN